MTSLPKMPGVGVGNNLLGLAIYAGFVGSTGNLTMPRFMMDVGAPTALIMSGYSLAGNILFWLPAVTATAVGIYHMNRGLREASETARYGIINRQTSIPAAAGTMRSRAVAEMKASQMAVRSVMGNEATIYHKRFGNVR